MRRLLTAVAAAVACPVVAAPIPDEAKAPGLYFPTRVGAKWVYDRAVGVPETAVVSGVEWVGRELVVSRAGADGTQTTYTKMVVTPAGLRQDHDVLSGLPGAVWLLKTQFRSGDSWPVPAEAGGGKRTAFGPELVAVPAGRYLAAKVVTERDGGVRLTSWYAPGVGEVKRVERLPDGTETVVRSLKAFAP